jgi:hypothetical protein
MPSGKAAVAREILGYLVHHQEAKDTLDGIRHYWIGQIGADAEDEREVEQAVTDLVTRGWVVKRETATKPVYSLNRPHLEDIRGFLSEDEAN